MMDSVPPAVTFIRDLVGLRLASQNELLQRLAHVHLTPGSDEFKWNLIDSRKFSVSSMYKVLIQLVEPIINNKFIWMMKIPLKTKVFLLGTYGAVLFLPKITLQTATCMDVRNVYFFHQNKTIKHLFFQCEFARSLYPPCIVANICGN
jgi:hypothetical protein